MLCVLGDSIPQRAGARAKDWGIENLRLPTSIAWWGIGGLTWSTLRRSIEANVLLSTPQKVLVLHLGGNDLCTDSCTKVGNNIKREIKYLTTAFTYTAIIWVEIIDRINWLSFHHRKTITSQRRRVNRFDRVCVQWASRSTSITVDIDANTPDVVHLSPMGTSVTSGVGVLSGHSAGCHYAIFTTHNV
ncbi:hypothetical protein DPMN_005223 [Dreissena polymorpha]|uniref:SGNH hydrolase-type esterase domain-containing protein n=1 Tax=Dreissena polymorpha TaxID=45954 RepID=A0A9D4MPV7_DREPO|nr:hypothetical protein DPMN_005223 [Dreissena polymorpha]